MKRALCFIPVLALILIMMPAMTIKLYAAPAVEMQNGSYNVTFKYTDNTAASVYIAGDFNSWDVSSDEWKMTKNSSGEWELTKTIDSGVYGYKLVVDGGFKTDQTNNTYYPGGDNSKLVVPGTVQSPVISGDSVTVNYPVSQLAEDVTSVKMKGDFNGWKEEEMELSSDGSHYTVTISGLAAGCTYEYGINVYTASGPTYGTFCKDYYNMEAVSLGGNSIFTIPAATLKDGNALIESRKPAKQLTGVYGKKLSDITFDDTEWTWTDGDTALSVGEQSYPACFNTSRYESEYDFSAVEGYDREKYRVEVNLTVNVAKADTMLTIVTDNMDREYDGNAVSNPEITKTGSTNDAKFTWFQANNDGWELLNEAPLNIGSYKVVVSVAEDSNYNGAETEKTFEIKSPGLPESHTHDLILMPAKDATCTEDGSEAYYVCGGNGGCEKWFSDAEGKQEILDQSSVVISKTGHDYENTWGYQTADGHAQKCKSCGAPGDVQAHIPGAAATETTPQICTVCGYEIAPAVNAPAASISTPEAELEDMLLTDEEKQQVQNGIKIRIILEVKNAGSTVSDADKIVIQKELEDVEALKGFSVGQYLDIGLYKLVEGTEEEERRNIEETGERIRIVITVPESLKNTDSSKTRTFAVIRVHDGKAELLPDLDGSLDTITIETDRFSTYAVVYQDTNPGGNNPGTGDNPGGNNPGTGDNPGGNNPGTGDNPGGNNPGGDNPGTGDNPGGDNPGGDNPGTGDNPGGNNPGGDNPGTSDSSGSGGNDNNSGTGGSSGDGAGGNNSGNSENTGSGSTGAPAAEGAAQNAAAGKDSEPKTGDGTPRELYATLAMIAGLSYVMLYFTERRAGMTEETKKELVSRLAGWAKRGGLIKKCLALAAIFVLLVYYHGTRKLHRGIGRKEVCGE